MTRGTIVTATLLVSSAACGFTGTMPGDPAAPDAGVAPTPPDGEVAPTGDAPPEIPPAQLFVASDQDLYTLDLAADTATLVGAIPTTRLDGLAFDGANLLGLDEGGASLLVIDPATAQITASRTLDRPGVYGMTVIPPGELGGNAQPIILAATATSLFRISTGGVVTEIGAFSDGQSFASDLAWVAGQGLFATLRDATKTDLVQLDPASAKTTRTLDTGYQYIFGLSGFSGMLLGVSGGGYVYRIDPATGGSEIEMMQAGMRFTEAAQ